MATILARTTTFSPPLVSTVLAMLRRPFAHMRTLHGRRQERRVFSLLSDDVLYDIGLTRAEVRVEVKQPMWKPIDYLGLRRSRRSAAGRPIAPPR